MRLHFGERDRDGDRPLHEAVLETCARHGVWAAALLRGVEGFGANARMRTERLLSLSEDQPLVAVAVGEGERVEALAAEVRAIAAEGLVVLEEVEVVGAAPGDVAAVDGEDEMVRATIWGPRTGAESPHLAAVEALHRHGAAAATVLLGVDGVLGGERRRARFLAANRGVPAITVALGERGTIGAALAELDGRADLVTFESVASCSRYARTTRHDPGAEAVRATLLTSEAARCEHHPRYLELIHSLRREGAAGATALRGVWGFRGDLAPHGDRLAALRRDVPLLVEVVDSPERAARWLELAESLRGEEDVAWSQRIPRIFTLD
jgi:PII-like signaling protein